MIAQRLWKGLNVIVYDFSCNFIYIYKLNLANK